MSVMDWIFKKPLTPQERLKLNQRSLQKATRELEREKRKLEQQETKLISEIRKMCKNGQVKQAKIKAKDLMRTKNYIKKFDIMNTKLNMINLRIQTIRTGDLMSKTVREATGLLNAMNRGINLPQLQKISMEFEKQNEMMDQKQEMMDESLDDIFEEEDEEEEADEFLNQIMDEIGVDLKSKLNNAPAENLQSSPLQEVQNEELGKVAIGADESLQARLDSLKR